MVIFRRNKKEEDYKDDYDEDDVSDDYDEDNITDDEKDIMLLLDLLLDAPDCNGCPGDAGCCG